MIEEGASTPRLPDGMGIREVLGIGALVGIGLTVSFPVENLAFAEQIHQNQAKLVVLAAAVISTVVAPVIAPHPGRLFAHGGTSRLR